MTGATLRSRPRTVLLTRPRAQAEQFAAKLRALGWTPILSPMQKIVHLDASLDLEGCRALLFTSQNGVAAFARLTDRRDLPALCVGPNTARAAREAGFDAQIGPGQADGLAAWVQSLTAGPVFHARGQHSTGDLQASFAQTGLTLRSQILYEQQALDLSPDAKDALKTGKVGVLMLFSPRSAELLGAALSTLPPPYPPVLCLSQAVEKAFDLKEKPQTFCAEAPNGAAMLAALSKLETAQL